MCMAASHIDDGRPVRSAATPPWGVTPGACATRGPGDKRGGCDRLTARRPTSTHRWMKGPPRRQAGLSSPVASWRSCPACARAGASSAPGMAWWGEAVRCMSTEPMMNLVLWIGRDHGPITNHSGAQSPPIGAAPIPWPKPRLVAITAISSTTGHRVDPREGSAWSGADAWSRRAWTASRPSISALSWWVVRSLLETRPRILCGWGLGHHASACRPPVRRSARVPAPLLSCC